MAIKCCSKFTIFKQSTHWHLPGENLCALKDRNMKNGSFHLIRCNNWIHNEKKPREGYYISFQENFVRF